MFMLCNDSSVPTQTFADILMFSIISARGLVKLSNGSYHFGSLKARNVAILVKNVIAFSCFVFFLLCFCFFYSPVPRKHLFTLVSCLASSRAAGGEGQSEN